MKFNSRIIKSCPIQPGGQHQPVVAAGGEPVVQPFFRTAKNIWLALSVCRHCGLAFGIQDTVLNDSSDADEVDRQLSELERDMKNAQSEPEQEEPEP